MVGASLNPLQPQISSLQSQRLSGNVSKKWLGWETALETVMYVYLHVFCMYYTCIEICTCHSCSSYGGCWLFLSGATPNQSLFSMTPSLLVFSIPLTATGTLNTWGRYLLNSPESLDLLLKRMESDYNAVSVKSRRPFGMKELDAHLVIKSKSKYLMLVHL